MHTLQLQPKMEHKIAFIEKYLIPALVVTGTFFLPMLWWFGAIGFFIAADLAAKLFVCLKIKEKIESSKLWRTPQKFGAGCLFIMVGFFCEKYIVSDIPMMKIIGSSMIIAELKSLDEKVYTLYGFSIFNLIIDKLSLGKKVTKNNNN